MDRNTALRLRLRKIIREQASRERRYPGRILTESLRRTSLASILFEEDQQASDSGGGMIDIGAGPDKVLAAARKLVDDPEKKKIFLAGATDGDPADEVVTIQPDKAAAKDLQPTQSEIGSSQSLDDQIKDKFGNLDNAINGGRIASKEGKFPVLVFGNSILDGHHRWSQAYATKPDTMLDVARISAPGVDSPEAALGLTHAILLALYGKSPTKPFSGENLFSMSADQVKEYVKANIVDSALQKLAAAKLISKPDKDEAADMYAKNLEQLKQTPGAYSRTVMPQPLDAGDPSGLTTAPEAAAAGKVNYNDPKASDVKGESRTRNVGRDQVIVERWQKLAGIIKG